MAFPVSPAAPIRSAVESDNRITTRLHRAGTEARNPIIGNSRNTSDNANVPGGFGVTFEFGLIDQNEQIYGSTVTIFDEDGNVLSNDNIRDKWSTNSGTMKATAIVQAGIDIPSSSTPRRAIVQVWTSRKRALSGQLWVSDLPANQVLLNGVQTTFASPLEILVEQLGVEQSFSVQIFPSLNDEVGRQHGSDLASLRTNVVKPYGGASHVTVIRDSAFVQYASEPVENVTTLRHTPTVNGETVAYQFQFVSKTGSTRVVRCFAYVRFTECEEGTPPTTLTPTPTTIVTEAPCPEPPVIKNPDTFDDSPGTIEEDTNGRYVRFWLEGAGDTGSGPPVSIDVEVLGYEGSGSDIISAGAAGSESTSATEMTEYRVDLPTSIDDADLVILRPSTAGGSGGALVYLRGGASHDYFLAEAVAVLDEITVVHQTGASTELIVSPGHEQLQNLSATELEGVVTPSSFTVTISNPTEASIRWRIKACAEWLTVSKRFGTLGVGESIPITVTPSSAGLTAGDYNGLVTVYSIDRNDKPVTVIPVRFVVAGGHTATGTTYYIDFNDGNDSNDGLTPATAWKHHPWDGNASGFPASTTLVAGDETIFKGGVQYRGQLYITDDGTLANRIIVDGNTRGTFGTGRARIDCSEILDGWAPIGGGVEEASLTGTPFPDFHPIAMNVHSGERPMAPCQWPVVQDDFNLWDDLTLWPVIDDIALISNPDDVNPYLIWSDFMTLPTDWWETAYIVAWSTGNRLEVHKITSYDSGTGKIEFDPGGGFWWLSVEETFPDSGIWELGTPHPRFVVINSPAFLTEPGTYAIDETAETIQAIAFAGEDLSQTTATARAYGINFNVSDYVHFRGLRIEKAAAQDFGNAIVGTSTIGCVGHLLEAIEITRCRSKAGRATVYVSNSTGIEIKNSAIYRNIQSRGTQIFNGDGGSGATDYYVHDTLYFANGGTGFYTSVSNGVKLRRCDIHNHGGVHGNGASFYTGTTDGEISECVIGNGNIALSTQLNSGGGNMLIAYNELGCITSYLGFQFTLAVYSGHVSSGHKVYNNTFFNPYGTAVLWSTGVIAGTEFKNNIADGVSLPGDFANFDGTNNVITDNWNSTYTLDASDIFESDLSLIYRDYLNSDFRLAENSPAIDAGTELGLTFQTKRGPSWDIGAYEYDGLEVLHRINCGSTSYVDSNGETWATDGGFGSGSTVYSVADPIDGTTDDTLYQSERGVAAGGSTVGFEYTLSVPNQTYVIVRVHLAEIYSAIMGSGQRLFDIYIDGVLKESEIDIYNEVGPFAVLVKEYEVATTSTSIVVRIENGSIQRGKINALEVLSTGVSAVGIDHEVNLSDAVAVSDSVEVDFSGGIAYNLSFEDSVAVGDSMVVDFSGGGIALFRINSGDGGAHTDESGFDWQADAFYSGATNTNGTETAIDVSDPLATDQEIYQTDRSLVAGGPYSWQYTLAVPDATAVTVQLHFAEIYGAIGVGGRIFDILIDGVEVETNFDIHSEAGGNFIALVKEYQVTTTSTSLVITFRNGPAQKAKVNGVAVFQD